MKSLALLFCILVQNTVLADLSPLPEKIRIAVENEIIASYTYRWADKLLVMKKEDIISMELSTTRIPSCDFTISGFANKPGYLGPATYQYWVCVATDKSGQLKAALINDVKIAEE